MWRLDSLYCRDIITADVIMTKAPYIIVKDRLMLPP